jgi:hypothetical protein
MVLKVELVCGAYLFHVNHIEPLSDLDIFSAKLHVITPKG